MRNSNVAKRSVGLGALVVLAFGVVFAPTPTSAQNSDSSTAVPVHMVVTAKPNHGSQAPAVAKDDVKVFRGGTRETVTSWVPLQGDRAGLQLFILIDETSRDSLSLQFSSIAKFIEEQPATTAIGVGYMRNGMVVKAQDLTKDHALAEKSLRLPIGAAAGYSSPFLSISDLMKKWPESADRREILMITNGFDPLGGGFSNDPFDNPYLDAAFDRAQRGRFIVYSIYMPGAGLADGGGFRTDMAQSGLALLSQKTGGESYYFFSGSPVDLTPYLDDVTYSLKHQYELTFLSKGAKKPALEPVKLKTEMPNMGLVTAEDGYVGSGM